MTTQPQQPTSSRTATCLALILSAREVGLAVATRERLVHHQVVNLRKIPSGEGRERRFRQVVEREIEGRQVTRIAVVELTSTPRVEDPLVVIEKLWLAEEGERRGLPVTTYGARVVKEALVPSGSRPTNRALCRHLVELYPELGHGIAAGPPGQFPTDKERYWFRVFLAIAGAVHDLDGDLKLRLDLPV